MELFSMLKSALLSLLASSTLPPSLAPSHPAPPKWELHSKDFKLCNNTQSLFALQGEVATPAAGEGRVSHAYAL